MRATTAAMAAALTFTGAVSVATLTTSTTTVETAKIKCDVLPSGLEDNDGDVSLFTGRVDPIVGHNLPESSHAHEFFATRSLQSLGNAASWAQVRAYGGGSGAEATSCRLPVDTAGYWVPSLTFKATGERVKVQQFTAYYRGFAGQQRSSASQAFPPDARLVAQDMAGYGLSGWTCGMNSTVRAGQDTIPNCSGEDGTPGHTLTAHINFPSCWDGVLPAHLDDEVGDTRDSAHYTYPTNKLACPAEFPRELVQLRETIQFAYTGDGTDVELGSDMGAAPGSTFHADFWNTWDQAELVRFVRDCIQTTTTRDCTP